MLEEGCAALVVMLIAPLWLAAASCTGLTLACMGYKCADTWKIEMMPGRLPASAVPVVAFSVAFLVVVVVFYLFSFFCDFMFCSCTSHGTPISTGESIIDTTSSTGASRYHGSKCGPKNDPNK